MRKCVVGLVFMFVFAAAGSLAADFWQKTKFTEWSDKDVQKMMTDSPWAKSFSVYLKPPRPPNLI